MPTRQFDIGPGAIDTPHGRLYPPRPLWQQIVVLFAAFIAGPAVGWLLAGAAGVRGEFSRQLAGVPFALIFFLGYGLWVAATQALAIDVIGRPLLTAAFQALLRRRRPETTTEALLPSRERLLRMLVRAQKAAAIAFVSMGWIVGSIAGALSVFADSAVGRPALLVLTLAACAVWGHVLARLGRTGWLPFAEGE